MSKTLLQVENLVTTFTVAAERVAVVDGLSFDVAEGEILALVGESGCGKSVTALSAMRLVPKPGRVEAGSSIMLSGRNILDLSINEIRKVRGTGIGMIFQEPMTSLNPVRCVGKQVVEAIKLHEKISASNARKRVIELFERVGIPDPDKRYDTFPHELSGGLKQRVMIAMAISMHSRLLIADEPTTALDVTVQAQILDLLDELRREEGVGILLITHDLGVVNEVADRVAVMYAGKIVERGQRLDILHSPSHPYTKGLLRSIPGRATQGERLSEIPGVVPSPSEWPEGCRFATRCPECMAHCATEIPAVTPLDGTHSVACHAVAMKERV